MIEEPPAYQGKIRFGVFEADLSACELRKSGIRIKLQSQPFKLLAILLGHAGEVVSRETLQQQIWGSETVVDFDHSLGTAVNKVREALGDSAEYPRYIETLAKRGYRFIAPVQPAETPVPRLPVTAPRPAEPARTRLPKVGTSTIAIALGSIAIGVLAGVFLIPHASRNAEVPPARPELRTFWNGVLRSPEPPLVVFSNAEFVGRPETGLRYFNLKTDVGQPVEDLYTGVGEALAIADLSEVLHSVHRPMIVKRSRLLTWDQTKNRDLIFVGSPSENLSLRDLAINQDFRFRAMVPGEPRPGDLALVNEHPHPNEPPFFFASPSLPLTEDVALITLQPGLHSGQNVLLLAGTTTLGTQAAAEFVCHNENLAVLLSRLGVTSGGAVPPFSVVVHARVAGGVPVQLEIAAIRWRHL